FLFNHFIVSYNDCMAFFYFCYTFHFMQALNLVVLAYDRMVAIMFPLQYQTIVTKRSLFSLIASVWFICIISALIAVGFLTRLSFCESVIINSYFCDHGQIYRLACNDNNPSDIVGYFFTFLVLWVPLPFILCSYICIGYALVKVATGQERRKAFKTCIAHLSLVAIYFVPMLITFTIGANIHPNARIINLSLSS
ncbi:olfactory receptor 6Y1-like, partial [Austrofundulus limnaeus]|uniref:Olfactory receptor 6Y1-like n=1 Tax=Austrofundulus limnaeus TaxID=52670 RepID=A0A2I4AMI0_AUSLI